MFKYCTRALSCFTLKSIHCVFALEIFSYQIIHFIEPKLIISLNPAHKYMSDSRRTLLSRPLQQKQASLHKHPSAQ